MKTIRKITSLLLAAGMTVSVLGGCGKKEESPVSADGSFTPSKMLELTVWETQGTDYAPKTPIKNDIVADWLKEKTKVTITNMYGNDGGQWDTKLAKLVAGNNLPDIIHCGAGQGPAHFSKLDEINQVWELTPEMIQKYAPEVWRRTPSEFWDAIAVNGKILGIPYKSGARPEVFPDLDQEEIDFIESITKTYPNDVTFNKGNCFWIRDDILKEFYPEAKTYDELMAMLKDTDHPIGDELLDIPIKTTEEYIDFMYKIKDAGFTSLNGKKVYSFGYDGGDNWIALTDLGAEMYGYKNHSYTGTWNYKTKTYEIPLVGDMIKQAAKTQNKMISDDVIEAASLAHTTAQFKEKILNGQYAICPIFAVGYPDQINAELEANGATFRFRPFITQVPNREEYPAFSEKEYWTDSICFLKTLSEQDLIQVLNWINVQYTSEYDKVRNWGPEEAGLYEETEDGKLRFKDDRFNKFFIEGDANALPEESDRMGIQGMGGLMMVVPVTVDHYNAHVMYRVTDYSLPRLNKGFAFTKDSEHVKNVKVFPSAQIWSSAYADIPEVVEFWGKRQQWEESFKMAIAAPENEFDEKWDQAVSNLNQITDVKAMAEKCTEIAKKLDAQIGAE